MEKQQLLVTLRQLHGELASAEQVDPETLELLQTVTGDMERLLKKSGRATAAEVEPVSSGLRDLVLKFEGDHPQLSANIGKVAERAGGDGNLKMVESQGSRVESQKCCVA